MARVFWFVVKRPDGSVVRETVDFERALAAKLAGRGRVIEHEWREAGPRLARSIAQGGES